MSRAHADAERAQAHLSVEERAARHPVAGDGVEALGGDVDALGAVEDRQRAGGLPRRRLRRADGGDARLPRGGHDRGARESRRVDRHPIALAQAPFEPGGDDRQLLHRLALVDAAVEAVGEVILDEACGQFPGLQRRVGEQRGEEKGGCARRPRSGNGAIASRIVSIAASRVGAQVTSLAIIGVVVHRDLATGVDAGVRRGRRVRGASSGTACRTSPAFAASPIGVGSAAGFGCGPARPRGRRCPATRVRGEGGS